jgi:hypothetical protein
MSAITDLCSLSFISRISKDSKQSWVVGWAPVPKATQGLASAPVAFASGGDNPGWRNQKVISQMVQAASELSNSLTSLLRQSAASSFWAACSAA